MARLLLVHHSPTAAVSRLTEAVLAGAHDDAISGVEVVALPALEATAEDVLGADGILLGTPANFGYMSGALKHFFDSTFLAIGGALGADGSAAGGSGTGRLPFGLYVHGRYDTEGAVRSVLSITGALPWRQSAPALEVLGQVSEEHDAAARELGGTLAALLSDCASRTPRPCRAMLPRNGRVGEYHRPRLPRCCPEGPPCASPSAPLPPSRCAPWSG